MVRLRYIILSAVSAMLLLGCSSKRSDLLDEVDSLKAQLPVSMGALGKLCDVEYDEDRSLVVYTINVSPELSFVADSMLQSFRDNLVSFASAPQNKQMSQTFVDAGSGMMFRYINNVKADTLCVVLSCDDIAGALANPISADEYYDRYLGETVRSMKSMLPRPIDYMTTLSDVALTDSALVFRYDVECIERGFADLKTELTSPEFKSELTGRLGDPSLSEMVKSLIMTKRVYRSVYTDKNDPSQSITVDLTAPELSVAFGLR